jgi:hypothetical protein
MFFLMKFEATYGFLMFKSGIEEILVVCFWCSSLILLVSLIFGMLYGPILNY